MQAISLKLQDDLFIETEKLVKESKSSRNAYINEALRVYNSLQKRNSLKAKLAKESQWVASDSLAVLKELEALEELNED